MKQRPETALLKKSHPSIPHNYEAPTSKKRHDVRWQIRVCCVVFANGFSTSFLSALSQCVSCTGSTSAEMSEGVNQYDVAIFEIY